MNTPQHPITEIGMIGMAVAFVIAATVLLFVNKIDFTQGTILYGIAAGLLGVNGALKAPSAQQNQLIGSLAQALATPPSPPAVVPPVQPLPAQAQAQPVVQPVPAQAQPQVSSPYAGLNLDMQRHWGDTSTVPVIG